jgi:hypothetical protein
VRLQRSCHGDRVSPRGESCLSTLKLTEISLICRKRVLLRSNRVKCWNWATWPLLSRTSIGLIARARPPQRSTDLAKQRTEQPFHSNG